MSRKTPYYITTPIYYVNDVPHIGHAYTTLACDVLARFKRLDGFDVKFLTGTDEHGQKVWKSAREKNIDPQLFTDAVSQNFRDLCDLMNFSNDDFIRTTEDRHKKAAQALWTRIQDNGHIYLDKYAGWYAVRDEAFYGEEELTTNEQGQKIAPSGAPVEWMEEESYFFDLSKWQDKLLAFYEANPDFVMPKSRMNEVTSFVKGGLRDLSVSRTSFDWGVQVPNDEKHIMYVWIDALTNYITAAGFPEMEEGDYPKFWPADLHMVGKDILRFHAVYWPAFLMAAGLEPPKRVFAHGWWTIEGHKMSKSLGNVIAPKQLYENYGLDQSRYFLMREVPFGNDGDFSHSAMVARINSDLSNGLGNLVQRTLSFVFKNCEAKIPEKSNVMPPDQAMLDMVYGMLDKVRDHLDKQEFHKALDVIWLEGVAGANQYIDEQAPWSLRKTDLERMNTVLFVLLETIRILSLLIQPFMPQSAQKILDMLKVLPAQRTFAWATPEYALKAGSEIERPEGVFPRYVEEDAKNEEAVA
jgi:methionyl-tRNA synthetase